MAQRVYRRHAVGWRAYTIPAVLWVASTLWLFHVSPGGLTTFNVVVAIVFPGMIFGIWLLTVWSIDHYAMVTITTQAMKVGRTTVPLAVLDREWILALAKTEAPTGFEAFVRSAGLVQIGELSTLNQAQGRYIGGAFGSPMGVGDMTLRKTNGEMITMPVKDRPATLTALLEAMRHAPSGG